MNTHITHCCRMHGCKYGDPGCPVKVGRQRQEFMCEFCYDELEEGGLDLAYLLNAMYDAGVRRGLIMAGVHEDNLKTMKMKGVR